jgi:hypothetical protein
MVCVLINALEQQYYPIQTSTRSHRCTVSRPTTHTCDPLSPIPTPTCTPPPPPPSPSPLLSKGIASFINHVPPGKQPNAFLFGYDVKNTSLSPEVLSYVPNWRAKVKEEFGSSMSYDENTYMRCVVCVATQPICNEEVLVDYRFNPKHEQPEWYTSADPGRFAAAPVS